jgi:amino acid adenylation domain-containing protein
MEPQGTGYNLSDIMEFEGEIDIKTVEKTFLKLIQRHESLRTSFHMIEDQPVQEVHDEVEFEIEYDQVEVKVKVEVEEEKEPFGQINACGGEEGQPAAALISSFVRPFDLSRAPLFRVGIIELPHTPAALRVHPSQEGREHKYILMIDMHHIISDGTSQTIFSEDFKRLCEDRGLVPLKLQYKDYAQWQKGEIERGVLKQQETYWLKEFTGDIPVLQLPVDYQRPLIQSFEGDNIRFALEKDVSQGLKRLARQEDVTLYMVLLAVVNVLLYKLSSQEDIVMGTPVVGRRHTDLEGIIGMFVNTLTLRNYPRGEKTFAGFLKEIREKTMKAFENQEYPFEELVDRAAVHRDMGRNPLFDVMFALHNQSTLQPEMMKVMKKGRYANIPFRHNRSTFDLTFNVIEAGELLGFSVEYSTKLFKKKTIQRFIRYLQVIVNSLSKDPSRKLSDIDVLSKEEIEQLLIEFNRTKTQYPHKKTLQQLFKEQVEKTPDRIAVVGTYHFHESTPLEGTRGLAPLNELVTITYRELNQRSNQLAYLLRNKGVGPDTIVGIMVGRSIEMITGLLGILKAGGAYMPIDPKYPEERIKYMLKDSGAKVLIITSTLAKEVKKLRSLEVKRNLEIIFIDSIEFSVFSSSHLLNLSTSHSSNLAYVIYTSGTTGRPKGVIIEHRNAAAYLDAFNREFDLTGKDIVVQQASFTFDVFFEEVFPVLLTGGKVVIPFRDQVTDINLMEELIIKHSVTIISCTPLMLNLLNQGNKLDSIRIFISGGDVLKSEYIGNLLKWAKVYNTYGPTETTVCATYYQCPHDIKSNVPLGKPIANYNVYILDDHHLVPIGVPGEICISGAGAARGYLNNPELTAEKFDRDFWDNQDEYHRSYMSHMSYTYKTGDLARWLPDGNIEFLGRIDSQIKIRGFRIEPGEIENQLLNYKDITAAVVVSPKDEVGDKYLCAYIVSDKEISIPPLKKHLSRLLPYYMIPAYIIQVEEIPLTLHGKVDAKALPKPVIKKSALHQGPRDWWEEQMTLLWSEVLGSVKETLSIDANFFDMGGHSLKATILAAKIHKTFNVKLPLVEVFKQPSIREQAGYIKNAVKDEYIPITPVEKKEYYDLSSAQKRLYILQRLEPGSTSYNMPQTISLVDETDIKKLEKTFIKLIERHESLRTSFLQVDEKPVQKVHDKVEFEIEYYDLQVTGVGDRNRWRSEGRGGLAPLSLESPLPIENFILPFDLREAPLLRVGLVKTVENNHILMLDMHHIITDGTAQGILEKEFMALFQEEELPLLAPMRLQYKDFSRWQNSEKQTQLLKQQEFYWTKAFADEPPVLNLPTDYPRPLMQSFEGNLVNFVLNENETGTLKNIAKENDTTLYMVVLSLFTILLSKLSGQEDIIVGTPIAARRHADLENIIGMFVNTLAMRNYPTSEKKFNQFLKEVKWRTLEVFENQEYQFEDLVDRVSPGRDTSRNPIFDVMFNLLNQSDYTGPRQDLDDPYKNEQEVYHHRKGTSKFDLYLAAVDMGKRLFFNLEYCTRLFKPATIERIIGYFKTIISSLADNPAIKLAEIEIVTEEEKAAILDMSKGIEEPHDTDTCIHRLFEAQAQKSPDQIALVGVHETHKKHETKYNMSYLSYMSYRELNKKSNQLAQRLREKGVKPDTVVGLMMERSIEMIPGILAVMKAGGAYLPIDTEYPASRKKYMLQDSRITLLLTNCEPDRAYGFIPANIKIIDISAENIYQGNGMNLPGINKGADLLYVIYTSGSTGNPKGVMLEHRNLVNLLGFQFKYTNIDCTGILQFTPISFDVSFQEIFSALLAGGVLYLVDRETRTNIPALFDVIRKNIIRTLFLPMSFLRFIFREEEYISLIPGCIEHIVTAGEQVIISDAFRDYLKSNHIYLHNHYGPSETHVVTTLTLDPEGEIPGRPSIGKPVLNTMIYILDKGKHLVPPGVPGELYIGGAQVGRGYWDRPGLTFEKFCLRQPGGTLFGKNRPREASGLPRQKLFIKKGPGERIYMSHMSYMSYIYRSGDLARWLPDGNIEFLGRIDNQVKIRGFRVELGEIQSRLLSYEGIEEAVVIARNSPQDEHDKYLCAYIAAAGGIEKAPAAAQLRGYLSQTLPDFMIPSFFVPLEQIPLNPNGKVDRKALPEPGPGLRPGENYAAPRYEMEEKLVEIWTKILADGNKTGLSIGIDDNFFELGGNSLKVIQLISEINKTFNIEVPMGLIFKAPYIRSISAHLMQQTFTANEEEIVLSLSPGNPGSENIFCFPPALGYGIAYMGLVTLLSRHSLYGFNYIEDEDKDRDKMEKYVDAMIEIQPRGPYILLGYSAGGPLCFKAAELLEKQGYQVKDIILLDCYSQRKALPDEVRDERIREFKDGIKQGLQELGLEPMTGKVMDTVEKYGQYHDLLLAREPVPLRANIHLIKAEDKQGQEGYIGWEAFTRGAYRQYEGFGIHKEMLHPDFIGQNAAVINNILTPVPPNQKFLHHTLSASNKKFLEFVERNPEALIGSNYRDMIEKLGGDILQPWPTFIDQPARKIMEKTALTTINLIRSIPERIFNNDPYEMSRYYQLPARMIETQLNGVTDEFLDTLIGRGDFALTSSGYKCLEFNIAGNIGGLHLPIWAVPYFENPIILRFLKENHIKIIERDMIDIFLEHLVSTAGETLTITDNRLNIVMVARKKGAAPGESNEPEKIETALNRRYEKTLSQLDRKLQGRVILCDFDDLTVRGDGLYYKDQPVRVVVESYEGAVPPEILHLFKIRRICLFNGPVTGLMSNKLNLALLSEHEDSPLFNETEREAIKTYIPWTRKIQPSETLYKGEKIQLVDFIRQNREQLVMKPAVGYGGEGVAVGKYISQAQWETVLQTALQKGKWLVQEYVPALPLLYQYGENGAEPHIGVVGFLVFGNRFARGAIRMLPCSKRSGVINFHQGARVSILFEIESR